MIGRIWYEELVYGTNNVWSLKERGKNPYIFSIKSSQSYAIDLNVKFMYMLNSELKHWDLKWLAFVIMVCFVSFKRNIQKKIRKQIAEGWFKVQPTINNGNLKNSLASLDKI